MIPNYDMRCHCGTIATKRQSSKANENYGRYFFCCSNNGRCKFFQWADPPKNQNVALVPNSIHQRGGNGSNNPIGTNTSAHNNNNQGNFNQARSWLNKMQNIPVPIPFCETHTINCSEFEVKKRNANFGRKFYSCPAERNCFFMWQSDWRSQYLSSNLPDSFVVTQKGRRYIPSSTSLEGKGTYTIKLELTGNLKKNKERVIFHLPDNDEVKACILSIISKYPGYKPEDKKPKAVSIPSEYMDSTCAQLHSLKSKHISIDPVPTNVLNLISNSAVFDETDDSYVDWSRFPESFLRVLKPFQRIGVMFGIQKNGICMISDEMGLGKTIQSIGISFYFRESWPLLIICPSSLRMNWSTEIERWLVPLVNPGDICIVNKSSDLKNSGNTFAVTIISYDLATKNIHLLENKRFNFIIADESHYLKSETSQRTKAIVPLMKNAKRKIMITGTPALSRPKELFPQVEALIGDGFLSSFEYKKRYCNAVLGQFGIDDNGSSNLRELNYLLKRTIMIRREKKHVLTELPAKLRVQLTVEISKQHKKSLNSLNTKLMKSSSFARSFDELQQMETKKNQDWLSMFRKTAEAKISAVSQYVSERIKHSEDNQGKLLIFAHHQVMLDAIEAVAKKELKKGSYIRIDGKTPNHQRQSLVDKFTDDASCQIAILSIQAAGTGLNFTVCNQVVFAELFWTPGALKQAEDRVHRLNQKEGCHITYIIGKDTLDEKIWPLILRKLEVLSKSLDMQEEDKELWKKSKEWGSSSSVIEMMEQKVIEDKIVQEDGMRTVAMEHEELQKSNFEPKIKEIFDKKSMRISSISDTLSTISSVLNQYTFCEEGDIPPPNQCEKYNTTTIYQKSQDSDINILNEVLIESPLSTLGKRKRDDSESDPKLNFKKSTSIDFNEDTLPINECVDPIHQKNHSSIITNQEAPLNNLISAPSQSFIRNEKKQTGKLVYKDLGKMFAGLNKKKSLFQLPHISNNTSAQQKDSNEVKPDEIQINPEYEQLIDKLIYKSPAKGQSLFPSPTKTSPAKHANNEYRKRLQIDDDLLDFM